MATPPPAVLRRCAEQLRELASAQRANAAACATLLDGVTKLDDAQTWQGSYPDSAHATFQSWVSGLTSTVDELRGEAASWSALADEYDRQAGSAGTHQ